MAAYEQVAVEIAGGIATVTLSRPDKLNAFDRAMCDDVLEALRMVVASEHVLIFLMLVFEPVRRSVSKDNALPCAHDVVNDRRRQFRAADGDIEYAHGDSLAMDRRLCLEPVFGPS